MSRWHRGLQKALILLLIASFCAVFGVTSSCWAGDASITPVPRPDDWWTARQAGIVEHVKPGNVDLLFIGDSITQGWEGAGKEVWARYYGNRNAVNMGIGGDQTQHVLWRLDNSNVESISPKGAVLMIGTNNWKDYTAEEIGAGIVAIIDKIRTKLPNTKILVLAIFPRNEKPDDVRAKLAAASAIAEKKADNQMVFFQDIGPLFLQPDGVLTREVMPDLLHLSPAAYETWAKAIEPTVASFLGQAPIAAAAPVTPPEGFTALFNGVDLTGWKGLVEDPEKRAQMKPEDLAAAQTKADEKMRAHWKAVDGVLEFDGQGDSLCTAKDYTNFEMLVDWKIGPKGDSGIYLRGAPQVQIWDPAQWPQGSGGLYNNEKNPKDPLKCADKPIGEWNTFRIKMVGEKVTVYLNDVLVVDNVTLENYWNRAIPIYPSGQIELQNHNSQLWFRNVFIKELP